VATKPKKQAAPLPPVLINIEERAHALADTRAALAKTVQVLREGLKKVTDKYVDDLRTLGAQVGVAHEELMDLVEANPALFASPRSRAFHGITVGYRKGNGKLSYEDAARVIARIEKSATLAEQIDTLAPATRKLSHEALTCLDAKDLKALGVTIESADDKPFIKIPADDVDKFVSQIVEAYSTKDQS